VDGFCTALVSTTPTILWPALSPPCTLKISSRPNPANASSSAAMQTLCGLALPFTDHRLVDAVLRRQLRRCQLATQRFQRYLCLEFRRISRPLARHDGLSFSRSDRA